MLIHENILVYICFYRITSYFFFFCLPSVSLCNLFKSRSRSQVNVVKNRMWHPNVNSTANGHIGLILDILDWNQSWTQKGKHWNWWYWLNYWKLPQVMKKQSGWSQAGEGQESITGGTMRKWYDLLLKSIDLAFMGLREFYWFWVFKNCENSTV